MKTGSLKTLRIGTLSEPDQVVQVLEELQHCIDLRELELRLSWSDEVRHVPFECNASQQYKLLLYICTRIVRFGGSACPPNKGSYLRDCLTALHSGVGVGVAVV